MTVTPAHVSPTARTIGVPRSFWTAAVDSQLYPHPRVIQGRYATMTPDTYEVDSVNTTDRTVTGWWLHDHRGDRAGQRMTDNAHTLNADAMSGEHWRVIDPEQDWHVINQPDTWLQNVTLAAAVESAGIGGEIEFTRGDHARYTVGDDVLIDHNGQPSPVSTFIRDGWNVTAKGDGSRAPGRQAEATNDTAETTDSERHSLFVAVALAGGVGGVVSNGPDDVPGGLRILSCDPEETGGVRWTDSNNEGDLGGVDVDYSAFRPSGWRVVSHAPESTPQTAVADRSPAILPRTADEAIRLRTVLRGVTRDAMLAGMPQDLLNAVDTLVLYLPGGEANRKGHELADGVTLCPSYEGIVCPTLGWTPRPDCSEYERRTRHFIQAMEDHERTAVANGETVAQTIVGWAQRYERGGLVNHALIDHIETHLESHKHAAASALLEELGLDGLEDVETEHEYEVEIELSETRVEYLTQTVTVTVTAENADEARDAARDIAWDHDEGDWDYNDSDVRDSSVRVIDARLA